MSGHSTGKCDGPEGELEYGDLCDSFDCWQWHDWAVLIVVPIFLIWYARGGYRYFQEEAPSSLDARGTFFPRKTGTPNLEVKGCETHGDDDRQGENGSTVIAVVR